MLSTNFILKFFKFGLVGLSGVFIDFGTTYLLKEILKTNRYVAHSTGFILAASSNYVLNRIWTFQSTNPAIWSQYATFVLISVIGLAITNLVIHLLTDRFRVVKFYFAKIFATMVVMLWNFLMNFYFTFA